MIITCKEDFDSLPQAVKDKLMCDYNDADWWTVTETMEYYEDPELSFIHYEDMLSWEVDIWVSHTRIQPKLYIEIPSILADWYHYLWAAYKRTGVPHDDFRILKKHYNMFQDISMGHIITYSGDLGRGDVDWLDARYRTRSLEQFVQNFYEYIEDQVKQWISNAETYLSKSYEDCFSEERVIENLICNEYEVDYED